MVPKQLEKIESPFSNKRYSYVFSETTNYIISSKRGLLLRQKPETTAALPSFQSAALHKTDRKVMQHDFAKIRPSAACLLFDGIRLRWRSFRKISSW